MLDGLEVPEPSGLRARELLVGVPIETATPHFVHIHQNVHFKCTFFVVVQKCFSITYFAPPSSVNDSRPVNFIPRFKRTICTS